MNRDQRRQLNQLTPEQQMIVDRQVFDYYGPYYSGPGQVNWQAYQRAFTPPPQQANRPTYPSQPGANHQTSLTIGGAPMGWLNKPSLMDPLSNTGSKAEPPTMSRAAPQPSPFIKNQSNQQDPAFDIFGRPKVNQQIGPYLKYQGGPEVQSPDGGGESTPYWTQDRPLASAFPDQSKPRRKPAALHFVDVSEKGIAERKKAARKILQDTVDKILMAPADIITAEDWQDYMMGPDYGRAYYYGETIKAIDPETLALDIAVSMGIGGVVLALSRGTKGYKLIGRAMTNLARSGASSSVALQASNHWMKEAGVPEKDADIITKRLGWIITTRGAWKLYRSFGYRPGPPSVL